MNECAQRCRDPADRLDPTRWFAASRALATGRAPFPAKPAGHRASGVERPTAAGRRNGKRPPPVPLLLVTQPTDGAGPGAEPSAPETPSPSGRGVQYKGAELDAERGPGLGCFRFQLVVLVVLLIATPVGVNAGWPDWLTAGLLFVTLALLLVAGQTVIFLLRLVAADRRSRRRPLASRTRTVGELDEEARGPAATEAAPGAAPDVNRETAPEATPAVAPDEDGGDGEPRVRQ
jgi:hypothetical protein